MTSVLGTLLTVDRHIRQQRRGYDACNAWEVSTATHAADPAVIGPYLTRTLGDEGWTACTVELLVGGRSNLTYRVDSPSGSLVLRRPPLGDLLPTAHDVIREFTIMSALAATAVPVPATLHLCRQDNVLGCPFYLMEHVEGLVCDRELPAGYADRPEQRGAIAAGLIETLAAIHQVDPASVGLLGLGRPLGYLRRQVARWSRQWEAIGLVGNSGLYSLAADLTNSVPSSTRAAIIHGDFRLDNTMLDPGTPGRVAAVLDWEMATLGDPLTDLAILLVYWQEATDSEDRKAAAAAPCPTASEGFPSRSEVAELYAKQTGADLEDLPWALSFAFFKLAVVCAGVAVRRNAGASAGGDFTSMRGLIGPLVELGRATLADGQLH